MEYHIIKCESSDDLVATFNKWHKLGWKPQGGAHYHPQGNYSYWYQTIVRTAKKQVKRSIFTPPTLQEIKDYIKEKEYGVDAAAWFAHYEKVGWKVGKNKMIDWKAGIRTWQFDTRNEKKPLNVQPKAWTPEKREPGSKLTKEQIDALKKKSKAQIYKQVGMLPDDRESDND